LDELPQLWNVLMEDVNIVGPRPEQRTFYDEFIHTIPFYGFRQIVRPGITGWAQISYGYPSSEDET
jgi:UDP-GalNAc:undecaprenyl-phosphate GalNAc-1-phosphate transferase